MGYHYSSYWLRVHFIITIIAFQCITITGYINVFVWFGFTGVLDRDIVLP